MRRPEAFGGQNTVTGGQDGHPGARKIEFAQDDGASSWKWGSASDKAQLSAVFPPSSSSSCASFFLSLWWALRRADENEFNRGFEFDPGNQLVFLKKGSQRR